jgi:hypothetical protein
MTMMSAPRPVSTPPTEVASRHPWAVVSNSDTACHREAGGKGLPVPVAGEDKPAVARQFVGEVLRVAGAVDLHARVVPETPGRKGDRGQVRLEVARRHADDQPADPARAHRRQFRGDQLVMPARREWGARVELAGTARCKAREVVA